MFKNYFTRVASWVGSLFKHGILEKEIREWLQKEGCDLKTSAISDIELQAIERPGWIQVYSFRIAHHTDIVTGNIRFGVLR